MAHLKRPTPGDWQRAAAEYQNAWDRRYRVLSDYIASALAVRLAAEDGERGRSERMSANEYREGVVACCASATAAMMIPTPARA